MAQSSSMKARTVDLSRFCTSDFKTWNGILSLVNRKLYVVLWGHCSKDDSVEFFLRSWHQYFQHQISNGFEIVQVVVPSFFGQLSQNAILDSLNTSAISFAPDTWEDLIANDADQFSRHLGLAYAQKVGRYELKQLFEDVYSLKNSAEIAGSLDSSKGVFLFARWDMGCGTGRCELPVLDSSLPVDYVYLADAGDIDEGYSDSWFVLSGNDVRRLLSMGESLQHFIRNPEFEYYCVKRSLRNKFFGRGEYWMRIERVLEAFRLPRKIHQIVFVLVRVLFSDLDEPSLTLKNSCVLKKMVRKKRVKDIVGLRRIFFKSFCDSNFQEKLRFLSRDDFDIL